MSETYSLRAVVNVWPIVDHNDIPVDEDSLPLSDRLLLALADWRDFFSELDGDLSDEDVAEEFVGQGYKLAYGLRRELKGRTDLPEPTCHRRAGEDRLGHGRFFHRSSSSRSIPRARFGQPAELPLV